MSAGAFALAVSAAGTLLGSRTGAVADTSGKRGVVLAELHVMSGSSRADTVVTFVTPGRVRVSHRAGEAILDVPRDRIALLDRATRTYRILSLRSWEDRIDEALRESEAQRRNRGDTLEVQQFELEGDGGAIAGYTCTRYHLYARRDMFAGQSEMVEQQVWVTGERELPGAAYDAYRRAVEGLDRLGLDARIRRPAGIVMRLQTRTRPEDGSAEEAEQSDVLRVERRAFTDAEFEVPSTYAPADSGMAGP